jgi:hypothetical protein
MGASPLVCFPNFFIFLLPVFEAWFTAMLEKMRVRK